MSAHPQDGSSGRPAGAGPFLAQILIDLKSPDPTARTAEEAVRTLLAFGDRLVDLRRRDFFELVLAPPGSGASMAGSPEASMAGSSGASPARSSAEPDSLPNLLRRYLETTAVLWNSNKQRAWLRVPWDSGEAGSLEVIPGRTPREGGFGSPGLEDGAYDHILVWSRARRPAPADLAAALGPWSIMAEGSCELYSLAWRKGATGEERRTWTEAVATARSRGSGLLVNPHSQDHRLLFGMVPIPFWSGSG